MFSDMTAITRNALVSHPFGSGPNHAGSSTMADYLFAGHCTGFPSDNACIIAVLNDILFLTPWYIVNNRHAYTFLSLFCALLFILGGLYTTFTDPVYTRVTIPLKKLQHGELRLALLSDLHIGPTVGQKRMEKIAELTNQLNPGFTLCCY
ncbi:hypothetical protein TELCIR_02390 [Teladorsagia circumcincta]|uniref:Calcineurin-like phosphoesterase domain-containing protein n=1 Tax=Teladorsagia circumcincta TaxID=45464 RepID=A0A2G9UZJ7_TELCI|nr:hypothetical protein TELCIR_02390 [Teladorsagia circumcincta]